MFAKREKKHAVTLDNGVDTPSVQSSLAPTKRKGQQFSVLFTQSKDDSVTKKPKDESESLGLTNYGDGHATYHEEAVTEEDGRAKAVETLTLSRKIKSGEAAANVYRGQSAYPVYAEKSDRDIYSSKFTGSLGPIKAPQHYRASCRFDYAMGICKDWKEAGYCGFGDSCIFVHDRSDYKSGYQMEKDWEAHEERLRKQAFGEAVTEEPDYEIKSEDEETNLCPICTKERTEPVVTECGHVFCLKCALTHHAKTSKCFECRKDTKGIFNNLES